MAKGSLPVTARNKKKKKKNRKKWRRASRDSTYIIALRLYDRSLERGLFHRNFALQPTTEETFARVSPAAVRRFECVVAEIHFYYRGPHLYIFSLAATAPRSAHAPLARASARPNTDLNVARRNGRSGEGEGGGKGLVSRVFARANRRNKVAVCTGHR